MSTRVETLPTAGQLPALRAILSTTGDPVATLARLVLALVMFPHGAQKVLGWFGGYGFSGNMQFFTEQLGIPAMLAFLAIAVEFLGPVALALGLGARIAAAGVAVNMAVAVWMVHLPNGFFMNWFGSQKGEGFEYHLLAIALALVVVIRGSGAWSLDRRLSR